MATDVRSEEVPASASHVGASQGSRIALTFTISVVVKVEEVLVLNYDEAALKILWQQELSSQVVDP